MSPDFVGRIAKGNAAVNLCLSRDWVDKPLAYTFNSLGEVLELL
jgi:hypothetical protein